MYLVGRRTPEFAPRRPKLEERHPLARGLVGAFVTDGYGMVDLTGRRVPVLDTSSGDVTPGRIQDIGATALAFSGDATNDRVQLGSITSADPLSLAGATECSVLVWCRVNSYAGFPRVIDKSNSGFTANGWGIYLGFASGDGKWVFSTSGASGGQLHYTNSAEVAPGETALMGYSMTSLSAGQWYKNGVPVSTTAGTQPGFSSTTTNAAIGNWNHATTAQRMFPGAIYAVLPYNRALSAAEHEMAYAPASRFGWLRSGSVSRVAATPVVGGGAVGGVLWSAIFRPGARVAA